MIEIKNLYPEIEKPVDLLEFYQKAKAFSLENQGFKKDIDWQNSRNLSDIESVEFYWEYVWVVLCSGFSVKAASNIFRKLQNEPNNFSLVKHPLKRKAIEYAFDHHDTWLKQIKECETTDDMLRILETLNHIGPVTKYHLGKNLGLQVAKPDIHLVRIAETYCSKTNPHSLVQKLCKFLSDVSGDKVPTVDLILWRYCEQHGSKKLNKKTNNQVLFP